MCIKRFELVDGQFKHTRHWFIENILGFVCEQHLLDKLNRLRQWYMYTRLTGTLERWINNHRSITEIERGMEPAAKFFVLK